MTATDPISFYAAFGPLTDPGSYTALYQDLPTGLDALCGVVNGLIIHDLWVSMGQVQADEARRKEAELRSAQAKLRRIMELDPRPLCQPRPFAERLIGNCRDEAQMLCSFLRYQGIAARTRVGFQPAGPNKLDHVICQVWSGEDQRWRNVDVQMDNMKRELHRLPPEAQQYLAALNPQDTPPEGFISGGQAWQRCRAGQDDPQTYCITNERKGWWFIRNNLLRDLLALNKIELIPWDTISGSLMNNDPADPSPEQCAILDRVAEITLAEDLQAVQKLYEELPELHIPADWLDS